MYSLIIHMLATIGFITLLTDRAHTFNIVNEFKNNINSEIFCSTLQRDSNSKLL